MSEAASNTFGPIYSQSTSYSYSALALVLPLTLTLMISITLTLTLTLTLTRSLRLLILTPTLEHASEDANDVFHWAYRIVDRTTVHDVRLAFVIDCKSPVR